MNKMTHEQFLLMKLAEEATEIAQIALKTAQFGMTEKHPDLPLNNKERIHLELNDLLAVVDELNCWSQFGFKENYAAKIQKIEKMNEFLGYSIELGMVENVPAIFDGKFDKSQDLSVGDLVKPVSGEYILVSGASRYLYAFVVSTEPFQLMSVDGDMYWRCTVEAKDYELVLSNRKLPVKVLERMRHEGLIGPNDEQVKVHE